MNKIQLANGMTVAYREAGSGQTIVVLHGFCGGSRYWEDALPYLSAYGRVIAPDLRGHGQSSAGEGTYSMELLADDIAGLMDALDVPKAHLIGHSLGGYVALAFAEKHPERLLSLGLAHSTSYPDTEAAQENRLKAVETIKTQGVAKFVEGLVPKLFAPEHRDNPTGQLRKAIEIGYETSAEGAVGCALGMRERPDRLRMLHSTELPILLLAGEFDEVIPPEKRFPVEGDNVTAVTLPGVGHMGMMEAPEPFATAIGHFLERNWGTAGV
ncbi:alpha/beta hydrolase [Cohnella endophytica]|uniref:Alpha/beta hydrolase n=1 Tax=Cohnella endophytica TaxID=2419778 RepID=A0A494X679_9BACL|nr:alpha/beta hydrolase [Cohnella endophytica]RKP45822.1 alpha/beta hydrolase [Cohnella endophytica]